MLSVVLIRILPVSQPLGLSVGAVVCAFVASKACLTVLLRATKFAYLLDNFAANLLQWQIVWLIANSTIRMRVLAQ